MTGNKFDISWIIDTYEHNSTNVADWSITIQCYCPKNAMNNSSGFAGDDLLVLNTSSLQLSVSSCCTLLAVSELQFRWDAIELHSSVLIMRIKRLCEFAGDDIQVWLVHVRRWHHHRLYGSSKEVIASTLINSSLRLLWKNAYQTDLIGIFIYANLIAISNLFFSIRKEELLAINFVACNGILSLFRDEPINKQLPLHFFDLRKFAWIYQHDAILIK